MGRRGEGAGEGSEVLSARIPFACRPQVITVFVVLVAGSIACSYWLGTLVRSPDDAALRQAPETVRVTAIVEERTVTSSLSIQGSVVPAPVVEIKVDVPDTGGRLVVTTMGKKVGDHVAFGDLLGTVSGVPVFLVPSNLPLYRDIGLGDEGPDVAALQSFLTRLGHLNGTASGKADAATLSAVGRWYKALGQKPFVRNGVPYLPLGHLAFGTGEGIVREAPTVGQRLQADRPFMVLSAGSQAVSARFTVPEADAVKAGRSVTIRGPGGSSYAGTIVTIGPFRGNEASKEQRAGHDVRIELAPQDAAALKEASTVSVVLAGQGRRGPAVPLSAVRQGAKGTYVMLEGQLGNQSSTSPSRDVPVTVLAEEGGWASIEAIPELTAGTKVMVG
jgi:peptidoglycan hydrolase-like protein with peptidoglycan-binding domain